MRDTDEFIRSLLQDLMTDTPPATRVGEWLKQVDELDGEEAEQISQRLLEIYNQATDSDLVQDMEKNASINLISVLDWTERGAPVKSMEEIEAEGGLARSMLNKLSSPLLKQHTGGI